MAVRPHLDRPSPTLIVRPHLDRPSLIRVVRWLSGLMWTGIPPPLLSGLIWTGLHSSVLSGGCQASCGQAFPHPCCQASSGQAFTHPCCQVAVRPHLDRPSPSLLSGLIWTGLHSPLLSGGCQASSGQAFPHLSCQVAVMPHLDRPSLTLVVRWLSGFIWAGPTLVVRPHLEKNEPPELCLIIAQLRSVTPAFIV